MSAIIFEDSHRHYSVFDLTEKRAVGRFGSLLDASSWCCEKNIAWKLDIESLLPFQSIEGALTSQSHPER